MGVIKLPDTLTVGTGGYTALTIDASGEKAAFVLQVPKTGNIDRISFRTASVTSSQTLRVSLQTVDGSGQPTGTLYGGSAAGTQATPAATTMYEVTLGTPAAAVEGDVVAAVVEFDSAVGNLQICAWSTFTGANAVFPYNALYTGTWAKNQNLPVIGIRYDDAAYYDASCVPFSTFTAYTFNSGTAGADEYGIVFSLLRAQRCVGGWFLIQTSAGSDFEMILYSGTTAQRTLAFDGDARSATTLAITPLRFASSFDLEANTTYRLAIRPTTANNVVMRSFSVLSAAQMGGVPLGTNCYLTKRLDQGAWSDVNTERIFGGLLLDDTYAPASGAPMIGSSRLRGI